MPARSTPLPAQTSVVIVGGGVMDTCAAFHLGWEIDPHPVAGYAFAARALGADLRAGCEVHGIEVEDGAITAVRTTAGAIRTFLQGPAVGEILRDLVLEREPFVDAGPLAVERFGSDELRPEFHVV